jgi:predicted esterase
MQGSFSRFLTWAGGALFLLSMLLAHTAFLKVGFAALTLVTLGVSQCRKQNAQGWTYGLLLLIPGVIVAIAFLGHRSSYFGTTQDPQYRSLYPDGPSAFLPRAALSWIPEADIASSMFRIGQGLNQLPKGKFYDDAMEEYDRLASEHALTELPSQAGLAIGGSKIRHIYLFVPEGYEDSSLPVIVFLHPSGANWQYSVGRWAAAVGSLPAAVAAPSFGGGNWTDEERGPDRVREILEFLTSELDPPPSHVVLAGAGSGGSALWSYGGNYVEQADGFVIVAGRPSHYEEVHRLKKRPVLVIHGDKDEKVRIDNVSSKAALCTSYDPLSRYVVVEGGGAHVFGTHHETVFVEIRSWLESLLGSASSGENTAAPSPGS